MTVVLFVLLFCMLGVNAFLHLRLASAETEVDAAKALQAHWRAEARVVADKLRRLEEQEYARLEQRRERDRARRAKARGRA